MKLVVFAHTPPPFHGQSYMVKLMLELLGGNCRRACGKPGSDGDERRIRCFHINARVSKDLADVGGVRAGKLFRMLAYCAQAIWCRIRYGADTIYYIPAPAKLGAIYRDWIVMLLCRPVFRRLVLHWHGFGLGEWARNRDRGARTWQQRFTLWLLGGADLSIVVTEFNRADAAVFHPKQIAVIPNGIPDPCPQFDMEVLPQRRQRLEARCSAASETAREDAARAPAAQDCIFRILFLAHCTREKGLFDAIDAVALVNAQLPTRGMRLHLTVAGEFVSDTEKSEFDLRLAQPDLTSASDSSRGGAPGLVSYAGFVSGEAKRRLLIESDCLCLPTYHRAEGQPVTSIEALAFGMPIVTTRWRGLQDIAPSDLLFATNVKAPGEVADALLRASIFDRFQESRRHFLETFHIDQHGARLSEALLALR